MGVQGGGGVLDMDLVLLDSDVSHVAARRRRPVRFLGRQLPPHRPTVRVAARLSLFAVVPPRRRRQLIRPPRRPPRCCKEPPAVSAPPPEFPGLAAPKMAPTVLESWRRARASATRQAPSLIRAGIGTTSEIASSASSDADACTAFDASTDSGRVGRMHRLKPSQNRHLRPHRTTPGPQYRHPAPPTTRTASAVLVSTASRLLRVVEKVTGYATTDGDAYKTSPTRGRGRRVLVRRTPTRRRRSRAALRGSGRALV